MRKPRLSYRVSNGGLVCKEQKNDLFRLPTLPVGSYGRLGGSPFITRPSWGLASFGGGLGRPPSC